MKYRIFVLTIMALFLVGVAAVWAGSYSIPNTFTSGTPAVAAEVNANFSAAKTAIDNNDSRVTVLENTLGGVAPTTWENSVFFSTNTPAVILSNTITLPDTGVVVAIATGLVFHGHINGTEDDMLIELTDATAGSSVVQNVIGMTHTRIPPAAPTGNYWGTGYSITRTFTESTAGFKKYYINAELQSGVDSYMYNNHLTLLYFPTTY